MIQSFLYHKNVNLSGTKETTIQWYNLVREGYSTIISASVTDKTNDSTFDVSTNIWINADYTSPNIYATSTPYNSNKLTANIINENTNLYATTTEYPMVDYYNKVYRLNNPYKLKNIAELQYDPENDIDSLTESNIKNIYNIKVDEFFREYCGFGKYAVNEKLDYYLFYMPQLYFSEGKKQEYATYWYGTIDAKYTGIKLKIVKDIKISSTHYAIDLLYKPNVEYELNHNNFIYNYNP